MLVNGDCVFIQTPQNKNILIDGGDNKYDVLLPYLLDKRVRKIDYIIVSHFDSDHSNGLIKVIEKIKVKNIVISKQSEESQEFIQFMEVANKKNISIHEVSKGDRIHFDKYVYIDVLYPDKVLSFEDLNNNSIVAKLNYNNLEYQIVLNNNGKIDAYKEDIKYPNTFVNANIKQIAFDINSSFKSGLLLKYAASSPFPFPS